MTIEERIKTTIVNVPDFPSPGISFKDVTTLFQSPVACREIRDAMKAAYTGQKVDAIIGLESRGFLFGFALALDLGIPFILIRKKGKLPRDTYEVSYELEYGSAVIEMHRDALTPGSRVLIHDDLLATGGTALAAARLVKMAGAEVAGFHFLVELSFLEGRKKLEPFAAPIVTFAAC